jgi:hypothetical protein
MLFYTTIADKEKEKEEEKTRSHYLTSSTTWTHAISCYPFLKIQIHISTDQKIAMIKKRNLRDSHPCPGFGKPHIH